MKTVPSVHSNDQALLRDTWMYRYLSSLVKSFGIRFGSKKGSVTSINFPLNFVETNYTISKINFSSCVGSSLPIKVVSPLSFLYFGIVSVYCRNCRVNIWVVFIWTSFHSFSLMVFTLGRSFFLLIFESFLIF